MHDAFHNDRVSITYQVYQQNQLYNVGNSKQGIIIDSNISFSSITIYYQNIKYPHSNDFKLSIELVTSPGSENNSSNSNKSSKIIDKEDQNDKTISIIIIFVIAFSIVTGICLIVCTIRFIYLKCKDDNINPNANGNETNRQAIHSKNNIDSPEALLKNFKEASYEECLQFDKLVCTICLLSHDENEKIFASPCHHFFHYDCIFNWVQRKNKKVTCPNCNFDLLSEEIRPLPKGYKRSKIISSQNKDLKIKLSETNFNSDLNSPNTAKHFPSPSSSQRLANSQNMMSSAQNNVDLNEIEPNFP